MYLNICSIKHEPFWLTTWRTTAKTLWFTTARFSTKGFRRLSAMFLITGFWRLSARYILQKDFGGCPPGCQQNDLGVVRQDVNILTAKTLL